MKAVVQKLCVCLVLANLAAAATWRPVVLSMCIAGAVIATRNDLWIGRDMYCVAGSWLVLLTVHGLFADAEAMSHAAGWIAEDFPVCVRVVVVFVLYVGYHSLITH